MRTLLPTGKNSVALGLVLDPRSDPFPAHIVSSPGILLRKTCSAFQWLPEGKTDCLVVRMPLLLFWFVYPRSIPPLNACVYHYIAAWSEVEAKRRRLLCWLLRDLLVIPWPNKWALAVPLDITVLEQTSLNSFCVSDCDVSAFLKKLSLHRLGAIWRTRARIALFAYPEILSISRAVQSRRRHSAKQAASENSIQLALLGTLLPLKLLPGKVDALCVQCTLCIVHYSTQGIHAVADHRPLPFYRENSRPFLSFFSLSSAPLCSRSVTRTTDLIIWECSDICTSRTTFHSPSRWSFPFCLLPI